ncbi:MAG TPA: efflux RND transporter periplasmic adaptor subunit [Candidatus Angelobacter sp.]
MPVSVQESAPKIAKVIPLPSPAKIRPKRRRIAKWTYWIALALLLAAGAGIWWSRSQAAIKFETLPVDRGIIEMNITATGTLNPVVNVQVGSQVSGNIKALYADFNTRVKKGQLVALIDPQIFQAQVDQASGAAAAASSAVISAQAQYEKASSDLQTVTANKLNVESILAKDKANALNAQNQWQRSEQLFREGVVSEQDHDAARAASDAAQAQVAADQAQIDAAEHNIQSGRALVDAALQQSHTAQAQQRQAEAALAQARINLEHTRILAPVSGTVIARHFDVGQTVAASFQAPDIFDIAQDLTQMQVDTNVDESDVGTIRTGQPVSFTVDAYPSLIFHGSVTDVRKAPIVAQNVVTYDVVIQVSNPDLKLFPGMTANVSILSARAEDVVKVPNAALRFRPSADVLKKNGLTTPKAGTQQIYLLAGGKLKAVTIKPGISDGKFTAISADGVKPGDNVVVRATAASTATSSATSTPGGAGARRPGM